MESKEFIFTPERVIAAKKMLRQIQQENTKSSMEARKKIQESGATMPLLLMTREELFDAMKKRAEAQPKITIRAADL